MNKTLFKYINFDVFCMLKDENLSDDIITYDEYFELRNINICKNEHNKIYILFSKKKYKINFIDVIILQYITLFIHIIEHYFDDSFPLNILIDCGWDKQKINYAFKSKKIYYLFFNGEKQIKINSVKSAINRYNYPALIELFNHGIRPTKLDLKISKYIDIKQITELVEFFIQNN